MKKFLILILIIGLAGGVFFSISAMKHGHRSPANSDCPLSPLHTPVCPEDALPLASHYISMYQTFANALASSVAAQVLMNALLFVAVSYIFRKHIASIRHLFILSRDYRAKLYRPQTLTRWLSLLVNSPSAV